MLDNLNEYGIREKVLKENINKILPFIKFNIKESEDAKEKKNEAIEISNEENL